MIKKAEIKGIDDIGPKFRKFLDEAAKNPKLLAEVGEKSRAFIVGSVRSRRTDYKVDNVSEGWADRRARLATANTVAPTYVGSLKIAGYNRVIAKNGTDVLIPGYQITNQKGQIKKSSNQSSNLTFTGQLLDSLTYKVEGMRRRVTLFFEGMHKPYKGVNGQPVDEPKSNAEIAKELNADKRFHFLFASEKLKSVLQSTIKANMRRQLSNYRKLSKLRK